MKSNKLAATVLLALVIGACGPKSPTVTDDSKFAIHEWGVLVGCSDDSEGFVTSRPEYASLVREPVIYVHKEDKEPFSIKAVFHSGEPTDTYPTALVQGDTVAWPQVSFYPELNRIASVDTSQFVPLEHIVNQLNDVDANQLYVSGQSARFLFYEGMMTHVNQVTATLLEQDTSVILHNLSPFTIYDVAYTTLDVFPLAPFVAQTAYVDSLTPDETDTVRIVGGQTVDLIEQLVNLGFTTTEAAAFSNLWLPSLYESAVSVEARGNLIYRIPQEAYDDLISLEVNPAPDELIRTLYVLTHLYDSN